MGRKGVEESGRPGLGPAPVDDLPFGAGAAAGLDDRPSAAEARKRADLIRASLGAVILPDGAEVVREVRDR